MRWPNSTWWIGLLVCANATLGSGADAPAAGAEPRHSHHHPHPHQAHVRQPIDASCLVALAPERPLTSQARRSNALKAAIGHEPPLSIDLLERLGWSLMQRAQLSRSTADLSLLWSATQCLRSQPEQTVAADFFEAFVLYTEHAFAAAESRLESVAEARGLASDWALLGDARLEQGDLAGAENAYRQLLDQRPGPDGYLRLALLRQQRGDVAGALEAMGLAAKAVGAPTESGSAWIHAELARLLFVDGRLELAARVADGVLRRLPDHVPSLLVAGEIALADGNLPAAEAHLASAVRVEPAPRQQWPLYETLLAMGRNADAERLADRIAAAGPHFDARTSGLFLAATGRRLDLAEALLAHELGDRRDPATLDGLAFALFQQGRTARAWTLIQEAVAHGTVDARIHAHAAEIAEAVGEDALASRYAAVRDAHDHMLYPTERAAVGS